MSTWNQKGSVTLGIEMYSRSFQRGLTLIEVMVAMTVGLILLIALGSMLIGAIRHYKVQDDFSRMQENGSYALNAIGTDVRMAGFYGEIGTIGFVTSAGITIDQHPDDTDCGQAWAISVDQPIVGYDTAAAGTAKLGCIAAANIVTTSPVVVFRGATGTEIKAPLVPVVNTLYIQSSPGGGVLFDGDDYPNPVPATLPPPWRSRPNGTASSIYPYQVHIYYLRPCSRPTGAGSTCQASDDDGHPIPTLVRQELSQGVSPLVMTEQSVAEGVERMSIMYGVDLDGDGFPNVYVDATDVKNHSILGVANSAVIWANVVTVKVGVLARAPTPSKGYDDSKKSYDFGDGTAAYVCAGMDCSYHRHLFAQTFQARNISQRMQ